MIRIVRFEDEPKAKLIAAFEIDDIQADAILNTRLRQLAKLEEMELRREHADLAEERDGIQGMLASDKMQWKLVGAGLRHVREVLGPARPRVGRRRSTFAEAPTIDVDGGASRRWWRASRSPSSSPRGAGSAPPAAASTIRPS